MRNGSKEDSPVLESITYGLEPHDVALYHKIDLKRGGKKKYPFCSYKEAAPIIHMLGNAGYSGTGLNS